MKKNFPVVISSLLIFLFIYTAISKLMNIASFRAVLHAMPLISSFANEIIYLIPFFEITTAGLLLFPTTLKYGLMASLLLFLSFTIYLVYALSTSGHLPCSCGGVISSMSWTGHIIFNCAGMLACCISIYNLNKNKTAPQNIRTNSLLQ